MSAWLGDFARARSSMVLLQDQQIALPDRVLAKFPRPSVLRVFQLDGDRLEVELVKILRAQIGAMFAVANESWRFRFQEELDLLLSLVLFKFTFWDRNAFYGDQLQNMVYRSESKAAALMQENFLIRTSTTAPTTLQKVMRLLLGIVIPYALNKLRRKALQDDWSSRNEGTAEYKISAALNYGETAWQALGLLNFLSFLRHGVYRSVIDRLLKLRLVNDTQRMNKVVNLAYMNQQVYWSVIFSFASFILPLLRLNRIWKFFTSFRSSQRTLGGDSAVAGTNTCNACGTTPICMPHCGECGHRFCYVCMASRMGVASGVVRGEVEQSLTAFTCPVCGVNVTQMRPAT